MKNLSFFLLTISLTTSAIAETMNKEEFILAFVHFFEPFWIFFRLPWQGGYCLQVAHDRRSPEL